MKKPGTSVQSECLSVVSHSHPIKASSFNLRQTPIHIARTPYIFHPTPTCFGNVCLYSSSSRTQLGKKPLTHVLLVTCFLVAPSTSLAHARPFSYSILHAVTHMLLSSVFFLFEASFALWAQAQSSPPAPRQNHGSTSSRAVSPLHKRDDGSGNRERASCEQSTIFYPSEVYSIDEVFVLQSL